MDGKGKTPLDSSDDPLEIALLRARIQRASTHSTTFGQVWAAHLERQPRCVEVEIDEAGSGIVRVVEREPVPVELSLILGEFLYELRAALDNCLYAVAVLESHQNPPPNADRLEWPICLDEKMWRDAARRRLSALSPDLQQALAAIQPFMAEAPHWNCLRILHDLARVDRHRAAHLTTTFVANAKAAVDSNHIADVDVRIGVVGADCIVATFHKLTSEPLRREHLDLNFTFEIEMAEVAESPHPRYCGTATALGTTRQTHACAPSRGSRVHRRPDRHSPRNGWSDFSRMTHRRDRRSRSFSGKHSLSTACSASSANALAA